MAITGSIPLSKMQGDLETTPGTAIAATRVLPILSGTLTHHIEDNPIVEQRASLIAHYYKPVRLKRWVEIDVEFVPTVEDIPWYLQLGLSGHATPGTALSPSTVNSTVKRYAFTSSSTGGVNQCATLEVGDDTQAYICTLMVLDRLEFAWSLGGMLTAKAHFMGAKAVAGTYTGALSAQGAEVFNGSVAKAYIDSSSIGTTLVTAPSDMTVSIDNNISLFWAPNGDIIPTDWYHRESRKMHMESTIRHTSDTENAAFIAQTQRKIRSIIEGSAIASSSPTTNRSLKWDWYGYWSDAPFQDADGLNAQRMSGDSVYDSSATTDWAITVDTAMASIA